MSSDESAVMCSHFSLTDRDSIIISTGFSHSALFCIRVMGNEGLLMSYYHQLTYAGIFSPIGVMSPPGMVTLQPSEQPGR